MKICSFHGCERKHKAKGLCHAHYNQINRGEELSPLKLPKEKGICSGPDCTLLEHCKGYCRPHYMQLWEGKPLRPLEGLCEICGEWSYLKSDHDHSCCSGKTRCGDCERGSLCDRCNMTLGNVKDDTKLLEQMVKYLLNYKENYNEPEEL